MLAGTILPNAAYRSSAIPIEFPAPFFTDKGGKKPKIVYGITNDQGNQRNLNTKKAVEGIAIPELSYATEL